MRDYEVLRKELPGDNEVAEALFHAHVALKKSRGEDVYNMKFGGEVESISGLEQFRAAVSSSGKCCSFHHENYSLAFRTILCLWNIGNAGASVVHFRLGTNLQCKHLSPFIDTLCGRYPSINFLQVSNLYCNMYRYLSKSMFLGGVYFFI